MAQGKYSVHCLEFAVDVWPGESITWTPLANKNFTANGLMSPFSVKLLDGNGGLSTETKVVQVSVTAVNDQPKIGTVTGLGVVQKNHPNGFVINFSNIRDIVTLTDDDGTPANQLKYRIEYVNSGILRIGNANTGALVDAPSVKPFITAIAGTAGSNEYDVYNWTPPLNATGSFVVMTLRAFDGVDYSASTADVVVSVEGLNAKPTINNGFTLGDNSTSGTKQNVPLLINYNTLLAQSQAGDTDLTPVYFRITHLDSGSLKVGSQTYTTAGAISPPALVGPGENIVWRPAQEDYHPARAAFRMRSFDNADQSDIIAEVKVKVDAVNQVPELNSEYTNTTGARNGELVVDFKDLAQQLNVRDVEDVNQSETDMSLKYVKMKFRVEQLMGGQYLKIGLDSGTATNFRPTAAGVLPADVNEMVSSGLKLFWMPPANNIGTYAAFRVTVMDSGNLPSANTAIYKVTISGSNIAPQISNVSPSFGVSTPAIENVPYTISFSDLQTALGVTDVDSPETKLVITFIDSTFGVIKKSGNLMAGFPGVPGVPTAQSIIVRDENIVYFAKDNLFGTRAIFKVRAWDDDKYSAEATVSLQIGRVNYKPRLTYVNDFSSATEDTRFDFDYLSLRGRTDLTDIEESEFGANSLRFVVKALPSGTLQRRTSLSPLQFTDVPVGYQISSNDVLAWQPPLNTYGRLHAFSIVALDGDNTESITTLPVYVNVASDNDLPTFGTTTYLPNAVEDQPYVITHNMLQTYFPASDVESGTVSYRITSLGGLIGTSLKKGTQTITTAELPIVINPGEFVTWQPPTNQFSTAGQLFNAFSVKALDTDGGVSSATVSVDVSIASVNDIPVIGTVSVLPASSQNNVGGINITHAMLMTAVPVTDAETLPTGISYRIESVNSGTLRMGNTNLGAVINPQVLRPLIINAVGDQTNTTGYVNWTPPLNAIGNYAIMTVRAVDGNNESSSTTAEVRINLNGSNAVPTIDPTFTLGATGTSTGTSQNVAMQIDYDTLVRESNAKDSDQTPLYFRITSLGSGTLTVGLNTFSTAGTLSPVPILGPGEKLVWKPSFNDYNKAGVVPSAFTIVATDNIAVSSPSIVRVSVSYVNQPPQMNAFAEYKDTDSALRNQYYTIDFSDMANRLGVTDSDDVDPAVAVSGRYNLMKFRMENIHSGQFLKVGTTYETSVQVVTGTTLFESGQKLYWMPPNNAAGIYDAFSVTAVDKDGLATANMGKVRVNINGSNAAPTAANPVTVLNTVMKTGNEGVPLTITYNEIVSKYLVTDVDSPWIALIVTQVSNGTLRKGGNIITPFTGAPGSPPSTALIAPGESVIFFPTANYNSSTAEIFKFLAYDGASFSDLNSATPALDPVPVTVNLLPVNTPPTLNATVILDGSLAAQRNTEYSISFDVLADKLGLADAESINPADTLSTNPPKYRLVKLRIEQMIGGAWLKNDSGTIDGSNNTIFQGQSLYWMPPNNTSGTFDAFVVSVLDQDNAPSLTTGKVSITVGGQTQAPQLAVANLTLPVNGRQNTAYTITHEDLKAQLGVSDADSSWVSFVVTSITNGTLKKGAIDVVAYDEAPSAPIPASMVAPYETLTFLPSLNTNGIKETFRVKAYDGSKYSTTAASVISINLVKTNLVPLMTRVDDLTGASEDTPYTFTYTALRAKTDASDLEETVAGAGPTQLKFRIKSINSGILKTSTGTVLIKDMFISNGDSLEWTPATDANGRLNAFSVVVQDVDEADSVVTLPVIINTAAVNDAPTYSSGNAGLLAGAVEDTPFVITHKMLQDVYPAADKESPVLSYEITALGGAGTVLKRGTQTLVANDLPIRLVPGESVVFTPIANKNYTEHGAQHAFSFRVVDADNGIPTTTSGGVTTNAPSVQANVTVAAVNDPPQFGTVSLLPNAQQNQNSGYPISYEMLLAAVPVNDVDLIAPNTIKYRIESVNNGVLRMGTSQATGVDVTVLNNRPHVVPNGEADGTLTTVALNWTPPLNALGNMSVMTLRAFDGTDYSSSTVDVRVFVSGSNKKPTINAGFTIGGVGTGTAGTFQNVTLPLSYDILLSQSQAADPDLTNVWFKVTELVSGTLTIGNVSYTVPQVLNPAPIIAPMERLSWRPALNATGMDSNATPNPVEAFKIVAFDNVDASVNPSLVKVNVAPVNQLPKVNASFVFGESATPVAARNTVYEIAVYDVADKLGVYDLEDIDNPSNVPASRFNNMKFRIEDVLGGQFLRVGTSLAGAVNVNRLILPTERLYWMPPNNMIGTFPAFTFAAVDSMGVTSANVGTVSIKVDGSSQKPVIANYNTPTNPLQLLGGVQNVPLNITHDQLKLSLGLTDTDSSWVSFVVTNISTENGELRRGGGSMVSYSSNTGTPPSAAVIAPRETVSFLPLIGTVGASVQMFKVRAYDGTNYSDQESIIKVAISAVNQAPTMNQVYTFSGTPNTLGGGAARNSPWGILFEDLAERLTVADLEDVNLSNPPSTRYNNMKFRIEGLLGGQYLKIGASDGTPETSTAIDTVNNTFNPGQKLWWLPPSNAVGSIEAFTLTLLDSQDLPSNYRARLTIVVSGINEKPVVGNAAPAALSGATQNMPFVITYDTLRQTFGITDFDSTYTSLVITSVKNGLVKKGTTNVSAFTGAPAAPPAYSVIAPSESVVYFPTNNLSGNNTEVLKVRAYDGSEYSTGEGTLLVNISPVNQRPQINAVFRSAQRAAGNSFCHPCSRTWRNGP
ncbi:MAG: hypothetical protein EBR09_00010 [Proteobacteria bacterium]|nr:hypothetical protein [Pseudomonadota bacterium]